MLDMGFEPQIRNIIEGADMPGGGDRGGRQTMMFSATFPRAVMRIADQFLTEPVMLKVPYITLVTPVGRTSVGHAEGAVPPLCPPPAHACPVI